MRLQKYAIVPVKGGHCDFALVEFTSSDKGYKVRVVALFDNEEAAQSTLAVYQEKEERDA